MSLAIGLLGANGRMGQATQKAIAEDASVNFYAAGIREGATLNLADLRLKPKVTSASASDVFVAADVVIDFTLASQAMHHAELAANWTSPLVLATTGHDDATLKAIQLAAQETAILLAPNLSIGVNLLRALVENTRRVLGVDYKVIIEETHHIKKLDAPSGTAKMLADASQCNPQNIYSNREGEVIGDHDVHFENDVERISLSHHAKDRSLFAKGAVAAAKWLAQQPPGLYSMKDMVGF